jgi:hypothetical protein
MTGAAAPNGNEGAVAMNGMGNMVGTSTPPAAAPVAAPAGLDGMNASGSSSGCSFGSASSHSGLCGLGLLTAFGLLFARRPHS